jgi:large subunit ribosomal protein L16
MKKRMFPIKRFNMFHAKYRLVGVSSNLVVDEPVTGVLVLKAKETGLVTDKEIGALTNTLKKALKKKGSYKVRSFAYLPRFERPVGVRMGKGKGGRERDKVTRVQAGGVIVEVSGTKVSMLFLKGLLRNVSCKLSVKTYVSRQLCF